MTERMRLSLYAVAGLSGAAVLLGTTMLWFRFGERVFFDRLVAGIAGCF